jgi:hypothetical protein
MTAPARNAPECLEALTGCRAIDAMALPRDGPLAESYGQPDMVL